jgi:predicted nuclease of predicted toxin-antitoxin system
MRPALFLDENVPRLIAIALRKLQFDVAWGCEFGAGLTDEARLAWATENNRVVVSEDTDFDALVFGRGLPAFGIVRYWLPELLGPERSKFVVATILAQAATLVGNHLLIEHSRVRLRQLPASPGSCGL